MADLSGWRLHTEEGRQTWSYSENNDTEQSFAEKYFLGILEEQNTDGSEPKNTQEQLDKAIEFYGKLQLDDGHWGNDYGGPMFLLPGLLITCYVCGVSLDDSKKLQMIRYLTNTQREDGGWGLHIESPSTMFGSALTYVSLRLLGMEADNKILVEARKWIKMNGGAQGIPSWGKFWLSALGVYEWEGVNPIPPEFWLFGLLYIQEDGGVIVEWFIYQWVIFMEKNFLHLSLI